MSAATGQRAQHEPGHGVYGAPMRTDRCWYCGRRLRARWHPMVPPGSRHAWVLALMEREQERAKRLASRPHEHSWRSSIHPPDDQGRIWETCDCGKAREFRRVPLEVEA